jgi:hypothetical protein
MSKDPENQSSEFPRHPKPKKIQASSSLEGLFANRPKPPAALDQPTVAEGPDTQNQNTETQEEKRARILKDAGVSQRPNPFGGNPFAAAKLNKAGAPAQEAPVEVKPKATKIGVEQSSLFKKMEEKRLAQEAAEKEETSKKAAEPIAQNAVKENIAPKPNITKPLNKAPQSFTPLKKEEKAQIDPEKAAAARAKWAAKMQQKSNVSLKDQLEQRLSPKSNTEQPTIAEQPQPKVSKLDLSKAAGLIGLIGKPRIPPQAQEEKGSSEQKRPSSRRDSKKGPSIG